MNQALLAISGCAATVPKDVMLECHEMESTETTRQLP